MFKIGSPVFVLSNSKGLQNKYCPRSKRFLNFTVFSKLYSTKQLPIPTFPYSQHSTPGRVLIKDIFERTKNEEELEKLIGEEVVVSGWVKTGREQGKGSFAFIHLNDGTSVSSLQILVDSSLFNLKKLIPTGTSLTLSAKIVKSPGAKQPFELHANKIIEVGESDPKDYPISKKVHSLEFLRTVAHLRPRSSLLSSVFRVRNGLSFATHRFFMERNFLHVHTPIITPNDCEGAGEAFSVTNLLPSPHTSFLDLDQKNIQKNNQILVDDNTKNNNDNTNINNNNNNINNNNNNNANIANEKSKGKKVGGFNYTNENKLDYSKDFFGRGVNLTVSGQLHAEVFACSMSNTYTFGPTFRAEYSWSSRHLAEFWMIEPEIAFANLEDVMTLAEEYIKYCCQYVLDNHKNDLEYIDQWFQSENRQKANEKKENKRKFNEASLVRLSEIVSTPFARMSYTEAVNLLLQSKKRFEEPVEWGKDLAAEHERYLAEEVIKKPIIVYNYPKDIKAFYMRLNEDGKTVAAMDILFPQIGELIGGSQREERFDLLYHRMKELNMLKSSNSPSSTNSEANQPEETLNEDVNNSDLYWYLNLRQYGTVKHAGFGVGFERLVMFITGVENIRDVTPFPRWMGNAQF